MYQVVASGVGMVVGPPVAHPKYLKAHPKWATWAAAHPNAAQKIRLAYQRRHTPTPGVSGIGCASGCTGMGCKCGSNVGMSGTLADVPADLSTLVSDLFTNPDGSMNWTAVAFAGVASALVYVNWGHTTRRGKR